MQNVADIPISSTESNPLQPVGSRRLPGLDGMRAISIALVLLTHCWSTLPLPRRVARVAVIYLANGGLGVNVFFVLSGFLITYLLRREYQKNGRISLRGFYARRVLRIFPALYTYLLTIAILSAVGVIHTTHGDLLCASTFLINYGLLVHRATNADYWFVGHFWTLSLEEQFYLLWPLIVVLSGVRRAWKVALVIVLACPFIRTASYFLWPASRDYLGMMLHCASDAIMMGCLAALLADRRAIQAAVRSRWAPYAAMGAALFVLVPSAWLAARLRGSYSITVGITINSALIAFCILFVTGHGQSRGVRVLEWPILRRIGVLSYSLYLWQQLFLGHADWRWAVFPVNLAACFAAALASNVLIEQPFLRLRGRFPSDSIPSPAAPPREQGADVAPVPMGPEQ